jgi:excisionase family DNA binding protein
VNRKLETLQFAADLLGIRRQQAAELARREILPVVRVGRLVRVDPAKLDEFIENGGKALEGGWRRKAKEGSSSEASAA